MTNGLIRFCKECGDPLELRGGVRWVSDGHRSVNWSCPGCGASAYSIEKEFDMLSAAEWEWVEPGDGSQHLALTVDGWPIEVSSFVHLREVEGMGWVEVPLYYGPDDPGPLGKLIRELVSQRLGELRAGARKGKAGKVGRPVYKPRPRLSYLWRTQGYQLQWPEMFLDGWPINVRRHVGWIMLAPAQEEEPEEWVAIVRTGSMLRKLRRLEPNARGAAGMLSIDISEVINQRLDLLRVSHSRVTMRKPRSPQLTNR